MLIHVVIQQKDWRSDREVYKSRGLVKCPQGLQFSQP